MKIKSKKWEVVKNSELFEVAKRVTIAVFSEYLAVVGPTFTVVGYLLWIAYSAGVTELAWYPYKGGWLLIGGVSLAMMGVLGLAIRAARAIWRRYKNSDLLTDDVRAEWPSWLK